MPGAGVRYLVRAALSNDFAAGRNVIGAFTDIANGRIVSNAFADGQSPEVPNGSCVTTRVTGEKLFCAMSFGSSSV